MALSMTGRLVALTTSTSKNTGSICTTSGAAAAAASAPRAALTGDVLRRRDSARE
jgi:hypothetical protein